MSNDLSNRMLTTIDNPFNPYTQFDEWNAYDIKKGYNTLSYIDRIAYNSSDLPSEMQDRIYGEAIQEILDMNILGIYVLATLPDELK